MADLVASGQALFVRAAGAGEAPHGSRRSGDQEFFTVVTPFCIRNSLVRLWIPPKGGPPVEPAPAARRETADLALGNLFSRVRVPETRMNGQAE